MFITKTKSCSLTKVCCIKNSVVIDLVKKAGYIIEENKEYIKEDYEKCATVISDYIMSHSKNDIPKIENEFRNILSKII